MADNIKTIYNKTKGLYTELGSSDAYAAFVKENGGKVETNLMIDSAMTLSVSQSCISLTTSVSFRLALPSAPVDGQLYSVAKASTAVMTVSLTGTNTAHTINGVATAVDLISAVGLKQIKFVGPANMWVTY